MRLKTLKTLTQGAGPGGARAGRGAAAGVQRRAQQPPRRAAAQPGASGRRPRRRAGACGVLAHQRSGPACLLPPGRISSEADVAPAQARASVRSASSLAEQGQAKASMGRTGPRRTGPRAVMGNGAAEQAATKAMRSPGRPDALARAPSALHTLDGAGRPTHQAGYALAPRSPSCRARRARGRRPATGYATPRRPWRTPRRRRRGRWQRRWSWPAAPSTCGSR